MDFALMEDKKPEVTWGKIVSHSKKIGKSQPFRTKTRFLKSRLNFAQIPRFPWEKTFSEITWLTLILFGLFKGYLFFTHSNYWHISNVYLDGAKRLSDEQLNRFTKSIKDQNIFKLNLSSLAEQLGRHPWVHHVSVERKLPNAIKIQIKERTPIARIQLDQTYVLDNFGVLLGKDTSEYAYLPIIRGVNNLDKDIGDRIINKSLAPSFKMMHYLNKLKFFQNDPIYEVEIQSTNGVVFITRKNHIHVRMNLENPKETFEKLKALLSLDSFSQTEYEYIDLSFRNRVVVKPQLSSNKLIHRS